MEPTYLSDAEARQARYQTDERLMRRPRAGLNVPGRVLMNGLIYLVDGNQRSFENQATNLVELTTEAAIRYQDAVSAHRKAVLEADEARAKAEEGVVVKDPKPFKFTVTVADLTVREEAFVHAPFAQRRPSPFARDYRLNAPIVGLDVNADGSAIDANALAEQVDAARANAVLVPAGFVPAIGGAGGE